MPDQPDVPETDAAATATPDEDTATPNQQAPKPTETVDFWKAKAREQEKRAKENADAATKLAAIEESQKTEQQKLLERAEAAERGWEQERELRQVEDWKAQVAKDPKYAGITADVLRGNTLEEIEGHAASLKALFPEPRTPGHVPAEGRYVAAGPGDPAQQFASIIRGKLQ